MFGEHAHFFRRRGYFTPKFNITFFYHKFDAKYFHVKQFFQKIIIFWGKLQKPVLGESIGVAQDVNNFWPTNVPWNQKINKFLECFWDFLFIIDTLFLSTAFVYL